ncbi:hypothetical protein T439DRAFT_327462 [Meredithblackwellia eburnea MCA 4105]
MRAFASLLTATLAWSTVVGALPWSPGRRAPSSLALRDISSSELTAAHLFQRDTTTTYTQADADSLTAQITALGAQHASIQQQLISLRKQLAAIPSTDRIAMIPLRRQWATAYAAYQANTASLADAKAQLAVVQAALAGQASSSSVASSTSSSATPSSSSSSSSSSSASSSTPAPSSSSATPSSSTASSSSASATPSKGLVQKWSGANFFDGWYWADYADPTHGLVTFVNQSYGMANKYAYINSNGAAVMTMDRGNSWKAPSSRNRSSVRISSLQTFNVGTMIILDMNHIPYGPGVWPAAWMVGPNWPYSGEIDIVEGVNSNNQNQATLHSGGGTCVRDTSASETGAGQSWTNCDSSPTGSSLGCSVIDSNTASFGPNFASAGGGVWAMRWDATGIFIWFWSRANVPNDVKAEQPNYATWGTPMGAWPASGCDPTKFFKDMVFVFDITLCGDWAGNQWVWENQSGAPSKYATCAAAIGTASLFTNAYFEVNYLSVYNI